MTLTNVFKNYLRSLPVKERVRVLREQGYVIERRRFRKGSKGFEIFSSIVMPRKKEIRTAISSPRGRFYYCYCIIHFLV